MHVINSKTIFREYQDLKHFYVMLINENNWYCYGNGDISSDGKSIIARFPIDSYLRIQSKVYKILLEFDEDTILDGEIKNNLQFEGIVIPRECMTYGETIQVALQPIIQDGDYGWWKEIQE